MHRGAAFGAERVFCACAGSASGSPWSTDQTEQGSLTFKLLYSVVVSEATAPSPALTSPGLVESSVLYQLPSCSCGALHVHAVSCHARWLEQGTCRGQPASYRDISPL